MPQGAASFARQRRAAMGQLNHAYAAGNEAAFEAALEELFASRRSLLAQDVQRLSESLLAALTRFRSGSRIATLAVTDVPDARLRLDHVLAMTEEAAHRTLDIIERTVPLADATVEGAAALADSLDEKSHREIRHFLTEVRTNAEQVRLNLTEVMLAQGFQDLTGQILGGVRTLVIELEAVLRELATVAGVTLRLPALAELPAHGAYGPAIPDISQDTITAQDDVDDLIATHGRSAAGS